MLWPSGEWFRWAIHSETGYSWSSGAFTRTQIDALKKLLATGLFAGDTIEIDDQASHGIERSYGVFDLAVNSVTARRLRTRAPTPKYDKLDEIIDGQTKNADFRQSYTFDRFEPSGDSSKSLSRIRKIVEASCTRSISHPLVPDTCVLASDVFAFLHASPVSVSQDPTKAKIVDWIVQRVTETLEKTSSKTSSGRNWGPICSKYFDGQIEDCRTALAGGVTDACRAGALAAARYDSNLRAEDYCRLEHELRSGAQ